MKLSIFTTITNPVERQDPFMEAFRCYLDLADELVIVDGGSREQFDRTWSRQQMEEFNHFYPDKELKAIHSPWPEDFDWPFIGQQFQRGYEACKGDWVIHADLDYIFHEKDMPRIRQVLEGNPDHLAFSFYKYQFLLVDRYNLKSRTVLAVNKRRFGSEIRFDSGGDLCQPSFRGQEITAESVAEIQVPFYNYDFCFKNLETINKDWPRFREAWKRHFKSDFGEFKDMMVGRFEGRSWEHIALDQHPKYIQERIKNITPIQFGFNMFGWIKDKAQYSD